MISSSVYVSPPPIIMIIHHQSHHSLTVVPNKRKARKNCWIRILILFWSNCDLCLYILFRRHFHFSNGDWLILRVWKRRSEQESGRTEQEKIDFFVASLLQECENTERRNEGNKRGRGRETRGNRSCGWDVWRSWEMKSCYEVEEKNQRRLGEEWVMEVND